MGRRKIEIKPIRDDRNRSVTFLKRKGGLFKKAHELSVLCSVDVAVIIFGHNKKLYEYSSSDIGQILGRHTYYGGAHEHKGPLDFADRGGGDDDDDDDAGDDGIDDRSTPQTDHAMMHHTHMQNHPGFQHVRHATPSASPPIINGSIPTFQRAPSPLPPGAMSRPASRTSQHGPAPTPPQHMRHPSGNLMPQPPPQPGYAYTPNPPFYNPQAQASTQIQRQPLVPHQASYPPAYPGAQLQPPFSQDDRRASMPPAFPPVQVPPASMHRHAAQDHLQIPGQSQPAPATQQPQSRQSSTGSSAQQQTSEQQPSTQEFASPPIPQPRPLPAQAKSHSIFTPIDDTRSLLAQHWGSTSSMDLPRPEAAVKPDPGGGVRSQSVDVATMQRNQGRLQQSPPQPPAPRPLNVKTDYSPPRAASVSQVAPPSRSVMTPSLHGERPRLKVQIPSEQSGDEGGTNESGPEDNSTGQAGNATAAGQNAQPASQQQPSQRQPSHSVVLPPPSPSAGGPLLSAGAQGPPNPFARPAPPMSTNPHAVNRDAASTNASNANNANTHANSSTNNNAASTSNNTANLSNTIETPISALPSRFMSDNLLPSPSTFYPDWGFGRTSDVSLLPSPLNFTTPIVPNGAGWRDDDRERKRPGEEGEGGDTKRSKT